MPGFRTWTWTRIDGRNVLAMPTRDEIHLYDSEDFILLDKIAPTGHRAYIQSVRWSAFHGKIASLSATQLIVHAPQLAEDPRHGEERVRLVRVCDFDLATSGLGPLRGLAFARNADHLLVGGPEGIGMLDIRVETQQRRADDMDLSSIDDMAKRLVWRDASRPCDVVKFSPCSFVFASFQKRDTVVNVWRMVRQERQDGGRRVISTQALEHPSPVVYASWKPATTQLHTAHEYDGSRRAKWFQPQRILLTCTADRVIRIWVEDENETHKTPFFKLAVQFEPTNSLDNVRWVLSKNRNISEEKFQVADATDEQQMDWISGVDRNGVLHLYQVLGVASKSPRVRDTELRVKVNGEDDTKDSSVVDDSQLIRLEEIVVMAYFSQNYFGMPSKFDIVLQRSDGILLSYIITVGRKDHKAHVKKKSWYRSHQGSIAALAAHPSLPLVASIDEHRREDGSWGHEILIYWVSFSAFAVESRLIPSGVLECAPDRGDVLCVQWIPTLHFEATPLFLVAYTSGTIDIYGRAANAADVVNSPRKYPGVSRSFRRMATRSPSLTPWTFYDYATGESGIEYEVARQTDEHGSLGFTVSSDNEGRLCVEEVTGDSSHSDNQIVVGDEVVSLNSHTLAGKTQSEYDALVSLMSSNDIVLVRFRAKTDGQRPYTTSSPSLSSIGSIADSASNPPTIGEENENSVEAHAESLRQSFLSSAESDFSLNASYVHAGSVSMYGGWREILSARIASSLRLVCVSPVYADDGEYIPETVIIFAVTSVPGSLHAWKGVHSSHSHALELKPLHIQDSSVLKRQDISSIAGERDYRQRAFTSKRTSMTRSSNGVGYNSLVFIGDTRGSIEHWRCRVIGDSISFTMMSSYRIDSMAQRRGIPFDPHGISRRGYCNSTASENDELATGIFHIEVDDPNRIAVLHAAHAEELHVFEGESGLGIMRLEESIPSNGRGRVLGFCWCSAHVEFNIDALAVHYESAIVIYQYDMQTHRWTQVGTDILTPLAIFDCTRDSSALLVGGGHFRKAQNAQSTSEETEEMPIVLGKWDEPGNILQRAMDWKAPESPQKLPVWHPYVVLTTLFGMHARVGVKDTTLASDSPAYEFGKAFKDAVQMLKLLAKVLEDDASTVLSAQSGVLAYSTPATASPGIVFLSHIGHRDSIGRYSTAIHIDNSINKAENLFGPQFGERSYGRRSMQQSSDKLGPDEATTLTSAIDGLLLGVSNELKNNASMLFGSFETEHLLELKAVLHFVNAIQSLGFELDASAADLGAKRFISMSLFGKSLISVSDGYISAITTSQNGHAAWEESGKVFHDDVEHSMLEALKLEPPSSGILWALHSDSQQFMLDHSVSPQATWEEIRPMWLGLWVRDIKDLRAIIERLAKSIYMRSRDAMDVVLFYVALGKKNILGALSKISKLESNKNLSIFLENDFTQDRWRNAAIKNAYSLLGKKQYEAAAAFFLLCEPPRLQEALRLLTVRLRDPSLALIVSRLVEYRTSDQFKHDFISSGTKKEITPIGELTKSLLQQDVIPLFRGRQDRWLESCALWWMEEFEQAGAVLLPQSQAVDVDSTEQSMTLKKPGDGILQRCRSVTHFFVNLTSVPIYFQYLYSSTDAPLIMWAVKKLLSSVVGVDGKALVVGSRKHKLASTADIEHAFSFSAYVCKRCGMSDTALIEMLQARHLVNLHAKVEVAVDHAEKTGVESEVVEMPKSPRMASFTDRRPNELLLRQGSLNFSSDRGPRWGRSPRRMSELSDIDFNVSSPVVRSVKSLQRAGTINWSQMLSPDKPLPMAPWLKAQIADIECRRWSSSAFVGKMIGIRVAREMITHFRGELDACFRHFVQNMPLRAERHRHFLEELCAPLCEQFQVDRKYVLEAALAVMQPHAYLHIAEICFLLAVLGRSATLTKWIQYVALSMLNSCSTFASCRISEDIYRDWESLTIQLCYILHLNAQGQIEMPYVVIAQVAVAVRTGCIFLSWCRQEWELVHLAITVPFYSRVGEPKQGDDPNEYFADLSQFAFDKHLDLIRKLQQPKDKEKEKVFSSDGGGFGFLFLRTIAAHLQGEDSSFDASSQPDREDDVDTAKHGDDASDDHQKASLHQAKLQKMYTLILMVSILRTLYARAQVFLLGCRDNRPDSDDDDGERDISSSLFTPKKLWRPLVENPLDGVRRWYSMIESHLRCEFDYSVKEVTCVCGLYGLDGRSTTLATRVEERIAEFEKTSMAGSSSGSPEHHSRHNHHHRHNNVVAPQHQPSFRLTEYLAAIGISEELHRQLLETSDDYILLVMRHRQYGVPTMLRRFRVDPRVHVKCFLLKDAFYWFTETTKIFATIDDARHFLSRCCKQRKLRLLVKRRGDDAHHFPSPQREEEQSESGLSTISISNPDEQLQKLLYQAMMFVDPWEVEAERSTRQFMHHMKMPVHVELGWDRLSLICAATCDDIADDVFNQDEHLMEMWRSTRGEGWLVTSITQYQLDGVHSHRTGHVQTRCVFEEEKKVPFLAEVHSRSQRNALFKEVGLPHRFVGVVTVKLLSGRELIPVTWIDYFSDPYVFFALSPHEELDLFSETWSIQTYRSRCAPGGKNPVWGHKDEDEFEFRFAIPTHRPHVSGIPAPQPEVNDAQAPDTNRSEISIHERIWNSMTSDSEVEEPVEGLESLFQHYFAGPPLFLHCAVYHKTKLFAHHFMGKGMTPLTPLTSGNPLDVWIPLEGVPSGAIHVQLSLSFQLMCSSTPSAAHSAKSYRFQPSYDTVSDLAPGDEGDSHSHKHSSDDGASSVKTTTASLTRVSVTQEQLLTDEKRQLAPHLVPRMPRSTGSRF
ncbi:hypothetical protein Poli38472_013886 [Pythium oligandrum]|uniref:PDZ domain-containing protein n=1 Tax=Pythium oligandrum TaxID=41045 RepID=A0A8K1FBS2_PYTOL|nr:hypothetical protein Poli38472_013886 [Pythium oligandrum]|eukprot:TMW55124.1 hypothetical protein Poli38472_013886 [Pythium oligandrum]